MEIVAFWMFSIDTTSRLRAVLRMARFLKLEAWKVLRRRGGAYSWEVAEDMIIGTDVAIKHLRWLVQNGSATVEGRYRRRRYYATVKRPESSKGYAPNSLAALAGGQAQWEARLAKAIARKNELVAAGQYRPGKRRVLPFRQMNGHGATLLEQLWPLPGGFASAPLRVENVTKARRGPSCVETPEDKEAA